MASLSDQDAYAVATEWREALAGHVQLVVDCDGPVRSIVESYAWVRISLSPTVSDNSHERASLVRATMVTWSMLSRSPGYSGRENPEFWKRVISDIQDPGPARAQSDHAVASLRQQLPSVSDAVGFFDQPDHVFPRFLVAVDGSTWRDENVVTLFGINGEHLTEEVAERLAEILATLKPHKRSSTRIPTVDLCLEIPTADVLQLDLPGVTQLVSKAKDIFRTESLGVRIVQINLSTEVALESDQHADDFAEFAGSIPVRVGSMYISASNVSARSRSSWIRALLGLENQSPGKATSICLERSHIDDASFRALITSLPFAKDLHSLTINFLRPIQPADLVWIAFAVFHPLAQTSSWRHLELRGGALPPQTGLLLSKMAQGNNSLALLDNSEPVSKSFIRGRLLPSTSVHVQPDQDSDVVFECPAEIFTTVDLCSLSTCDASSCTEWIGVIMPAYGLGWVRSTSIAELDAHTPSASGLQGFLYAPRLLVPQSPENLLQAMKFFGTDLRYLDISANRDITTRVLKRILGSCEALKVLITPAVQVEQQGESIFSKHKIEELEIVLAPFAGRIGSRTEPKQGSPLQHLRAFRVRMSGGHAVKSCRAFLYDLLTQTPSLEYLHWSHVSPLPLRYNDGPIPYELSCRWLKNIIDGLELTGQEDLWVDIKFSQSAVRAFLSVFTNAVVSPTVRLVDRDVVQNIIEFATSSALRRICIDPYGNSETHQSIDGDSTDKPWRSRVWIRMQTTKPR